MPVSKPESTKTSKTLSDAGLRPTRQRKVVFDVICGEKDHPSAELVHERAKKQMAGISLATVYNCLDSFVACGLVRQLNFQRQPSRYCAFTEDNPHFAHFHRRGTGDVYDVILSERILKLIEEELPEGLRAEQIEVTMAGTIDETAKISPHTPISKKDNYEPARN